MSARTSFLLSAAVAALPFLAALFGVYQFFTATSRTPSLTPIVGMCQVAYTQSLDVAGHVGMGFVITILAVFTSRALFVLWRTSRNTTGLKLKRSDTETRRLLDEFPRDGDLNVANIEVVDGSTPFALTLGFLRPRIVVSSRLLEILDRRETEAVLRHELAHVRRRDPLRVLLADFFRAGLPFIPILSILLNRFALQKEIEADALVVQGMGSPAPLAAALSKVLAETSRPVEALGAGLTPTEARIDALLGASPPSQSRLRFTALLCASALALSLMSGTVYVLFSSPRVVTLHICG